MHARVSLLVTVSLCHKSGRIFTGMSFNHKADVSQTEVGFLQQIECCSLWSNKTPWTSQKPTFDLKIIMSIQKVTLPGKSTTLLSRHDIWCIGAKTTSSQINLWFYTHLMAIQRPDDVLLFLILICRLYQSDASGDIGPISVSLRLWSLITRRPHSSWKHHYGGPPLCHDY